MASTEIRAATIADIRFLWEMMFEAVFTTDEERAAWRREPEPPQDLRKYLDGWVLAIALAPEHRGRGIGGALLAELAWVAASDGFHQLVLSVDPDNARAVRLYQTSGYVLVDTEDPARGTSLIMRLDL